MSIMEGKPYHHGNLRIELIEEGLALIHEEGRANFSLRKVAKRVGVSPTACYNHFEDIEDLLNSTKEYITNKFCAVLLNSVNEVEDRYAAVAMGRAYVLFFAENPFYFSFIYDNEDYCIELTSDGVEGDYEAFVIFKRIAIRTLKCAGIPEDRYRDNLIVMWATVHGLAAMANMKGFHYKGNWGELTENILCNKLILD